MKNRRSTINSIARLIVDVSERQSGTHLKESLDTIAEWIMRNRIARHLPAIQEGVEKLLLEQKGLVPVQVRSARPLDEAAKKILVPLFKQLLGKDPMCHYQEDLTVVGGVRAQTDTHLIRASVADALEQLAR